MSFSEKDFGDLNDISAIRAEAVAFAKTHMGRLIAMGDHQREAKAISPDLEVNHPIATTSSSMWPGARKIPFSLQFKLYYLTQDLGNCLDTQGVGRKSHAQSMSAYHSSVHDIEFLEAYVPQFDKAIAQLEVSASPKAAKLIEAYRADQAYLRDEFLPALKQSRWIHSDVCLTYAFGKQQPEDLASFGRYMTAECKRAGNNQQELV